MTSWPAGGQHRKLEDGQSSPTDIVIDLQSALDGPDTEPDFRNVLRDYSNYCSFVKYAVLINAGNPTES